MESRLARIEQWLARHGVLTREAITAEGVLGGFSRVYPILRALEERGQVRRGYFIEGLGALQFADPAAVDRLRETKREASETRAAVLAATDPANPFGVSLPWPEWCEGAGERRARTHVVIGHGELVALLLSDGERVLVGPLDEAALGPAARAVVAWMGRRALRIIGHQTQTTPLNKSPLAPALRAQGLAPSGPGFRR
jgi:ATP-dependent Lhr-like helicase